MNNCEATVLRTLAFFDVFDYAPTEMEVWRWQLQGEQIYSLEEIRRALVAVGALRYVNCFSLPGREVEERYRQRQERFTYSIRKNRRLMQLLRLIRWLRPIEAVAVCNTRLPFHFAPDRSDIDLCVFAKRGSIWESRFLLLTPLSLLRQRPGERMEDAFDASIFIDSEALDLRSLADISPVYLAAWIGSLQIVYGEEEVLDRVFEANAWIKSYFKAAAPTRRPQRWRVDRAPLGGIVGLPKGSTTAWQERHFTPAVQSAANTSSAVVINDQLLKFHLTDRRAEIQSRYEKICQQLAVTP